MTTSPPGLADLGGFALLEPWQPLSDKRRRQLDTELLAELPPGHVLAGTSPAALAARADRDDVLFEVPGVGYAVVHLSWSGRPGESSDWPRTEVFDSLEEWRDRVLLRDHAGRVGEQLDAIAGSHDDFVARTYELTEGWEAAGAGIEVVEPVLRFMETHPSLDLGVPGPLVHFVERFLGSAYIEALTASLDRRPTSHTAWMLHRVLNVTEAPEARAALVQTLERARRHPHADDSVRDAVALYLDEE